VFEKEHTKQGKIKGSKLVHASSLIDSAMHQYTEILEDVGKTMDSGCKK
jgi:hypothetical protein